MGEEEKDGKEEGFTSARQLISGRGNRVLTSLDISANEVEKRTSELCTCKRGGVQRERYLNVFTFSRLS